MDSIFQKYNNMPNFIRWIALFPVALIISGFLAYIFQLIFYSLIVQIFTIEGLFSLFFSESHAHNIAFNITFVASNILYALLFLFLVYKLSPGRKKLVFTAIVAGRFLLSIGSAVFLVYRGQGLPYLGAAAEIIILIISITMYNALTQV